MENLKLDSKDEQALADQISHTLVSRASVIEYTLKTDDFEIQYSFLKNNILVSYQGKADWDTVRTYLVNMTRKDFTTLDLENEGIAKLFLQELTISDSRVFSDNSDSDHPDNVTYPTATKQWYNGLISLQKFLKKRNLLEDLKYAD